MPISYQEALKIVNNAANDQHEARRHRNDVLTLSQALGRVAACDICSPLSTPTFASSAMDGYAVISSQLTKASLEYPVRLRVLGTMAAGDMPMTVDDEFVRGGLSPCVEIMTGAAFPALRSGEATFDACVPWEHVRKLDEDLIEIVRAPLVGANKRPIGGDFREGEVIVAQGEGVASQHVMALASVGVHRVSVVRKVRVGVLSAGSELIPLGSKVVPGALDYKIHESNGPYLMAALQELDVDAKYLGCVADDMAQLTARLAQEVNSWGFDLLITTGGVSSGKFDYMPICIDKVGGKIQFHHVAMRPGHPCLFATFPRAGSSGAQHGSRINGNTAADGLSNGHAAPSGATAVFALPGNPVASAACLQFLVRPYIRQLVGCKSARLALSAKVVGISSNSLLPTLPNDAVNLLVASSSDFDTFRHGTLKLNDNGWLEVVPREKSPSKTGPFVNSNCWIHVPRGSEGLQPGSTASIYPFSSWNMNIK